MKSIVLPAGTEHVLFGDLADLIADALFPLGESATDGEMMAHGGACINLEAQLLQAVMSSALPVKDPLTFGPHSFPVGNALKTALVSVNDLRVFLADRFINVESAPAQSTATPAPVGAVGASGGVKIQEARQKRRYQMGIDAGLSMPRTDYEAMPRGIGKIAKLENITRQAFTEDLKAHIRRTFTR